MAETNLPPGFLCSFSMVKNPDKTPGNETYESGKTKPDFVVSQRYVEKLKKEMPATFKIVGLDGYNSPVGYLQEDGSLKITIKKVMKQERSNAGPAKAFSAADDFLGKM